MEPVPTTETTMTTTTSGDVVIEMALFHKKAGDAATGETSETAPLLMKDLPLATTTSSPTATREQPQQQQEACMYIENTQLQTMQRLHKHIVTLHDNVELVHLCFVYAALRDQMTPDSGDPATIQYLTEEWKLTVPTVGLYRAFHYIDLFPKVDSRDVCRPVEGFADTFIVDRKLHVIMSLLIDKLLLVEQEANLKRSVIDQMEHLAAERADQRARWFKHCDELPADHDHERVCPLCTVLYTRLDSAFYQRCCERLNASTEINYTPTIYTYCELEHLAFPLVLFLCGGVGGGGLVGTLQQHESESEQGADDLLYTHTNQWIRVPLWYVSLAKI